ncbi:MAG TPA: cysteine desulfurase-like protein [Anaerolineales bacterium]|nr:cysteine desulfurase-like protein [Anaerolineales bacterium]
MTLDVTAVRRQFPALQSDTVFFDNPGGTQVPQVVIDRMLGYLTASNANRDGAFRTSRESDRLLEESRRAMAAFVGAARPEEIVFGPNMTSLTLQISRSLAREFLPGDEVIVTRLDHDANIAPWRLVAEERGCLVRWLDFDPEDCTLDLARLDALLSPRTRLVAVGYASNAVGTVNPVAEIARRAHAAGALCFVDAVQYAPHRRIDVQAIDCDFLAASAYKFFGPHLGMVYGRHDLLARLRAYKVPSAPDAPPGKFETGTQLHENILGALGAAEYLASLAGPDADWAVRFDRAFEAIQDYEDNLTRALLAGLQSVRGLRIYGITDASRRSERLPTVSFTLEGRTPRQVAERLAEADINVWDGNFYAQAVTERLGLEDRGGLVRVGAVHYNTEAEVDRLVGSLRGG